MMRKRFAKAALASVLAVSMAATATNWVAPNAFVDVVQAEGKTTKTVGVNYWDVVNGIQAGESEVSVDSDAINVNTSTLTDVPEGYELVNNGDVAINGGWIFVEVRPVKMQTVGVNYYDEENDLQVFEGSVTVRADANSVNTSALTDIPAGYELVNSGDATINDGWIYVAVRRVATEKTIGVNYWDVVNNTQVDEGEVTIAIDANNVNTSALTDIPVGYELVNKGDVTINDGWIFVEVRPAVTEKTVGVNYWDVVNNTQAGEGEVTVTLDANNVNTSALTDIPAGYELVNVGDIAINDNWIFVEVKPVTPDKVEIGVNYWDVVNNIQAGEGKVTVDGTANNVNTSALTDIPAGYELVNVGDIAINDGWIFVEVKPTAPQMIQVGVNYWDVENNVQAGEGKVFVEAGSNNVNTSVLTDVPAGYYISMTGDVAINDGWIYVEVKPVESKGTIINVVYKDAQGRPLGGGDYIVDLDGDGIANYSELPLPEGYQLTETGDFFVNEGTSYTVTLKRAGAAIIHVQFVSDGGKVLGGGDYFVDADGDGIANYSELTLPEGYELIETGDFFVDTDKDYVITVSKIIEGTIINVVYVDKDGNVLGGGDYFVDADDDGIANYSELTLPEGYELIVTGDFFVNPNHSYTIELQKIQKGTMINVVFEDEEGNNLGGGDYIVDEDGDGIANYSELDLPVGYELIVTGDFFVEEGESYTIVLKMRETVLTVTFEDTEGNVVDTVTLKAGQPGSPEETYAFVLGEHFNLPEGYQLAEGVDQVTTIEIPYGSVGGHTMIVEKIAEEPGETPEEPTDPKEPGETPEEPTTPEEPGETPETPETSEPAETDDTPKTGDTMMMPYYAAFGAGISLLAMLLLVRRRLVK